jgi:hypothetical protein
MNIMRRSWATWSGAVLLLLGTVLLGGCKQKEGDRCQLDSDCSEGLFCCVNPGELAKGGICTLPGRCELKGDQGPGNDGPRKEGGAADKPAGEKGAGDGTPPDNKTPTPDTKAPADTRADSPSIAPDSKPDTKTGD